MEANAQGGTKVICLGTNQTYTLSRDTAAGDDDTAAEDDLDILANADITIEGNGSTVQRDPSLTCNLDYTEQVGEFRIFHVLSGGSLTLKDLTVRNGCADEFDPASTNSYGGGIFNDGTVNASFVTIANNTSNNQGGGIYNLDTFNIKNSIVANNTVGGSPQNCTIAGGTFTPSGVNFADDGTCTGFSNNTPLTSLNLQPLGNYGGPTQTIALGAGSVAIDAVTDCTDLNGNTVSTDQRGVIRPQGTRCDAGAYEYNAAVATYTLSINPPPTNGNVTSSPPGINCGSSGNQCSANFTSGTNVQLTATPDSGYTFAGWGGACSSCGTSTTCNITMDANKTCSANFTAASGGGGTEPPPPNLSNITSPEFGNRDVVDFKNVALFTRKGPAIIRIESQSPIFISGIRINEFSRLVQEQNFILDLNAGERPCGAQQFNLAGYCTVGIIFEPKSEGKKEAFLEVYYNTPNPVRIYITGTGVSQQSQPQPQPQPSPQPPGAGGGGSSGGSGSSAGTGGGGGGCSMSSGGSPLNALAWLMLPGAALLRRLRRS